MTLTNKEFQTLETLASIAKHSIEHIHSRAIELGVDTAPYIFSLSTIKEAQQLLLNSTIRD